MVSFAWELRLRPPALKLPIGNVCLGSFAWEPSLENFRLVALVWDPSFGSFRFGTFVLTFLFWSSRLGTVTSKPSLRNFRFGELSVGDLASEDIFRELSLWSFAFGYLVWDLCLVIFGLGCRASGAGILRLGKPPGGVWENLVG